MMNTFRETAVGFFVLLGLLCVAYLAVKLGKMEVLAQDGFQLNARFTSVSGLRAGADVEMAGVPVGKVSKIVLDRSGGNTQAVVTLRFTAPQELTDDTIASIKTSGLIGDKYISLSPGGSDRLLASGDMLEETESSIDLESLIGKYAFGGVDK